MDNLDLLFWMLSTNYILLIVITSAVGHKIGKLEDKIRELTNESNKKDM